MHLSVSGHVSIFIIICRENDYAMVIQTQSLCFLQYVQLTNLTAAMENVLKWVNFATTWTTVQMNRYLTKRTARIHQVSSEYSALLLTFEGLWFGSPLPSGIQNKTVYRLWQGGLLPIYLIATLTIIGLTAYYTWTYINCTALMSIVISR